MNELTVTEPIEGEVITPEEWDRMEAQKKQARHSAQAIMQNAYSTARARQDAEIKQQNAIFNARRQQDLARQQMQARANPLGGLDEIGVGILGGLFR